MRYLIQKLEQQQTPTIFLHNHTHIQRSEFQTKKFKQIHLETTRQHSNSHIYDALSKYLNLQKYKLKQMEDLFVVF